MVDLTLDLAIFALATFLVVTGVIIGSVRRVTEGNEVLVERLGKYHRRLKPGLNFGIYPIIDEVVAEVSTKEQILDCRRNDILTKDNVQLKVDTAVFWRVQNSQYAYYYVQDVADALRNLVISSLRSEVSKLELDQTFVSEEKINRTLVKALEEPTKQWGIEITRIAIQNISLPEKLVESLEKQKVAENEQRTALSEVENDNRIQESKISSTVKTVGYLSTELSKSPYAREILQYFIAQNYIDANLSLSQSDNTKVVFMDPRMMAQMPSPVSDIFRSDLSQDNKDTVGE